MNTIVEESSQNVTSNAGIFLVKQILDQIGAFAKFNDCQPSDKSISCQKYSNAGIAKDAVTLMALGKTSFSDIAAHQKDDIFADAVGEEVPSEATFRQRLGYLAIIPEVRDWVDEANIEILSKVKDFGLISTASGTYLPTDMDVSVLVNDKCRKEKVGFTYHKVDGFAPIFATVGTLGYQLANELRPGSQHSQKEFPEFLRRCVELIRKFCPRDVKVLLRLDSAHDADDTLKTSYDLNDEISNAVESSGLAFIVKRNARSEDICTWIDNANSEHGRPSYSYTETDGAKVDVFRGVVSHRHTESTKDKPLFCVWELKRTVRDGDLFPEYSVATWWTNLPDDADTVVRLYQDHATCEQFHSELKTDMGIERLPSGDFKTNELFLSLSTLAFNVLRRIGQTSLETDGETKAQGPEIPEATSVIAIHGMVGTKINRPKRIRLRTVILNLIYVAAINGSHGGRRYLRLGRNCHMAQTFIATYRRLAA